MYKLLFFFTSLFLLLTGCGVEPTPQEKAREESMAAMRAKMEARQKQMFSRTEAAFAGEAVYVPKKISPDIKDEEDPTAYVYEHEVLSPSEEKSWVEAGINNEEYPQWAKLGIGPEEAKEWKKLNISHAAVDVFRKQGYTPAKAKAFMAKEFFTRPNFYAQFGTPVYEFDSICQGVIKRQQAPFAFLEERCLPYMEASHKNEAIGHLLDEAKIIKGPLALEYLAELRRLAASNSTIQSGMEVTIEEFMEEGETENFTFLFPLLANEPTAEEMKFIDRHKLPLTKVERFYSYQNPQYWIRRTAAQEAAKEAAARQEALLREKDAKEQAAEDAKVAEAKARERAKALKEEQLRQQKLAQKNEALRRQKAQELCGAYIKPDQLSGEQALLIGEIVFTVGERGSRMFGYGVKSVHDQRIYFVRDPKDAAKAGMGDKVSWVLKTMGRTEALSKSAAQEYAYDKKSKTKFEMALLVQECKI